MERDTAEEAAIAPRLLSRQEAGALLPDLDAAIAANAVTFNQLTDAHYLSRGTVEGFIVTAELQAAYIQLLPFARKAFEGRHGLIRYEFWCNKMAAAAILTESCFFDSFVNWQGDDIDAQVVPLLNRIERIWARAQRLETQELFVLAGIYFSAYSAALDALDSHRDDPNRDNTKEIDLVKSEVNEVESYYREAASKQATTLYFVGVLWGMAVLIVLADIVVAAGRITTVPVGPLEPLVVTFATGATGAVVSVISRLASAEGLVASFEASAGTLRLMGALRPIVGAFFGSIVHVLVLAGLLPLDLPSDPDKGIYFLMAIGFFAGFSERWVKDILSKPPGTSAAPAAASST